VSVQGQLGLTDYHAHADRYHARLQVIRLYYQGWAKVSIMRVLQVSRPTVNAWIRRFEAEHFAGLVDKPRGPKHPRKVWLPLIVQVYHLDQRAHLYRNLRFGNNALSSNWLAGDKRGCQNNPRFSYCSLRRLFWAKIDQKTHQGNQNQVHGPTDSFLPRRNRRFLFECARWSI
jgi:hypothetical protein